MLFVLFLGHGNRKNTDLTDLKKHFASLYVENSRKVVGNLPKNNCGADSKFPGRISSIQELKSNVVSSLASDWMNLPETDVIKSNVVDLEVFIGCCDVPSESELAKIWIENRPALLALLKEVRHIWNCIDVYHDLNLDQCTPMLVCFW